MYDNIAMGGMAVETGWRHKIATGALLYFSSYGTALFWGFCGRYHNLRIMRGRRYLILQEKMAVVYWFGAGQEEPCQALREAVVQRGNE